MYSIETMFFLEEVVFHWAGEVWGRSRVSGVGFSLVNLISGSSTQTDFQEGFARI